MMLLNETVAKEEYESMEKFCSEVRSALDALPLLKSDGQISTMPFLNLYTSILNVLEIGKVVPVESLDLFEFNGDSKKRSGRRKRKKGYKLYKSFGMAYKDYSAYTLVGKVLNASSEYESGLFMHLMCMSLRMQPESELFFRSKQHTESMDFTLALLDKLTEKPSLNLTDAVEESYCSTLKPFHGWISSAAYKVALKLLPDRKTFISSLMAEGEDYTMLKEEIQSLNSELSPLLIEIHSILIAFRQDRLKST